MEITHYSGGVSKSECAAIIVPFEEPQHVGEKWCPRCRRWRPANTDNYHSNKRQPGGLSIYCKKCNNADRIERKVHGSSKLN